MIVDELILKLKAGLDEAQVRKELGKFEADAVKRGKEAGEKMGKAAGTSFADVFQAVAGAAVVNSVKGFFSKAATEFNKFEAAFLRVDSIAKGFGRSVSEARKQVDDLASKGFLNLNQAASSYADAIALGFDEKQARKFIDSLSDIAAFQNTIGDGAAAVQSGLAGLLSNSAEKVENIGVPVKVLNMQYNENIKTMGKAAALQKFYNGILKESEKFSGDAARAVDTLAGAQSKANAAVDRAMVSIGKGLEPMLKKLYNTVEDLAKSFFKWFEGLDSGTKTLVLIVPLVAALTLAAGTLLPILRALAMTNPFGWVAAAVVAVGALVAALHELVSVSKPENLVRSYKETRKELSALADKAADIEKQNIRTIKQNEELVRVQEALRKKAKELGVDYDELAKKTNNLAEMSQLLSNVQRQQAAENLVKQRRALEESRKFARDFSSTEKFFAGALPATSALVETFDRATIDRKLKENDQAFLELYKIENEQAKSNVGGSSTGKAAPEFRFIKARDELRELQKEYLIYIAKNKDEEKRAEAARKLEIDQQRVIAEMRGSIAQFIEDEHMAKMEALKVEKDTAETNARNLYNADIDRIERSGDHEIDKAEDAYNAKVKLQKRLSDIQAADARKQALITAESFQRTAQAAQATTTGLAQTLRARDIGGALSGQGAIISGVSGISPTLKTLAPVGAGLAAAGGIFALFTGLFGKSDEERAREAEEQRRRDEEAKAILELQASYQKSMLAIQEAQAKLPFENLQRNLRLIDIQSAQRRLSGESDSAVEASRLAQRQSAIQGVINSESGRIAEGNLFGDVNSSPEGLISFLNQRAADAPNVAAFMQLMAELNWALSPENLPEDPNYWVGLYSRIRSFSGKVPSKLYSLADRFIKGFQDTSYIRNEFGGQDEISRPAYFAYGRSLFSRTSDLVNEITRDTGIAENLLSTIEQSQQAQLEIASNTKKTADNTSKALELRPDRERSFIDVGLGFIQSLGQRITSPTAMSIAQNLAARNFTVPTDIGTASLTASRARTLQERMADVLEKQLIQGATANDILRDIRAAAVELVAVMDGNPATVSGFTLENFTALQSEANRRRV